MAEETKERTSRPRLTVTAMLDALEDIYLSTLPENDQDQVEVYMDLYKKQVAGKLTYHASLFKVHDQDVEATRVLEELSEVSYEHCIAQLLEKAKDLLEIRKKEILASLSSVSDRHRATIRGARKKTKNKE